MAKESVPNQSWPVIILGDLNVDLEKPEGTSSVKAKQRMETATLVEMMGMTSLRGLFRQNE